MWTRHIRPAPPPVAPRPRNRTALLIAGLTTLLAVSGCTSSSPEAPPAPEDRQGVSEVSDQTPAPSQDPSPEQEPPVTSDGRPQVAYLTIPELDIRNLRVEPYQGQTDDAPGTEIQDRGIAASPHGPSGGVGPGGIGNYQVTAHRNSAGGPFLAIPDLQNGARIEVATDQRTYVYQVIETRETSFRSERSLAEQRAAVPGHPGRTPSQAMITLSTCATQEDHAAGNYWADDLGNPEHRIDKIGILISSHPA